jgi:hypothetical protein
MPREAGRCILVAVLTCVCTSVVVVALAVAACADENPGLLVDRVLLLLATVATAMFGAAATRYLAAGREPLRALAFADAARHRATLDAVAGATLRYETVPDPQGKLTGAEQEQVRSWLGDQWTQPVCPFHGRTSWEIGDVVQTMPYASGLLSTGPVYPLIVLTCQRCGYTVFINAIRAGILPHLPPATPQQGT